MKFLHLSDLHIGKRVNEFSMLEDQRYILEQILKVVDREMPEAVILAGDVYDKAVPPAEAVQVLDEFLTVLAERGRKVFLISGNHDSSERLAFGARLMEGRGVYVSPVYDGKPWKIQLEDEFGPLFVWMLPFVKPAVVRHAAAMAVEGERLSDGKSEGEEPSSPALIATYQDAVRYAISRMEVDVSKRNLLIAHQFVTGAGRCESEEVMVGGIDQVDAELFEAFDYVALGHIHSPQHIGRETVRYCGTPLKYSFSEAEQEKSVTVAELLEKGRIKLRTIPLSPLRDMRKIRGTYLEVTARSFYENTNTRDYVQITLTDEEDIPDGLQKLRIIYPNLMQLEYDNRRTRQMRQIGGVEAVEEKSELQLFSEFYELQNNQPMSGEQKRYVEKMIEELKEKI